MKLIVDDSTRVIECILFNPAYFESKLVRTKNKKIILYSY